MDATKIPQSADRGNASPRKRGRPKAIRIEPWGHRSETAVYEGGELVAVCTYRRGAESVAARLRELLALVAREG